MKLPTFFKPKKKLRASTARRMNRPDEMDYEEMSEPNMKLSRALLIVLVLHVVAVAGIIAFNTIKSRQSHLPSTSIRPESAQAEPVAATASAPVAKGEEAKPAPAAVKAEPVVAKALPVNDVPDGKVYTVVKGDNPVSIARKLKVSESELLRINHIEDPRKLQIGQKLIIPQGKKAKK